MMITTKEISITHSISAGTESILRQHLYNNKNQVQASSALCRSCDSLFPKLVLYTNEKMHEYLHFTIDFLPFCSINLLMKVCNSAGYNQYDQWQEYYSSSFKYFLLFFNNRRTLTMLCKDDEIVFSR